MYPKLTPDVPPNYLCIVHLVSTFVDIVIVTDLKICIDLYIDHDLDPYPDLKLDLDIHLGLRTRP